MSIVGKYSIKMKNCSTFLPSSKLCTLLHKFNVERNINSTVFRNCKFLTSEIFFKLKIVTAVHFAVIRTVIGEKMEQICSVMAEKSWNKFRSQSSFSRKSSRLSNRVEWMITRSAAQKARIFVHRKGSKSLRNLVTIVRFQTVIFASPTNLRLGDECEKHRDCETSILNSQCYAGFCRCQPFYAEYNGTRCLECKFRALS